MCGDKQHLLWWLYTNQKDFFGFCNLGGFPQLTSLVLVQPTNAVLLLLSFSTCVQYLQDFQNSYYVKIKNFDENYDKNEIIEYV